MKYRFQMILQHIPWLLLLFGVDAFFAVLLWIANVEAFYAMAVLILLSVVIMFSVICYVLIRLEGKREQVFLEFLDNPDEYHEELLIKAVSPSQREAVRLLGRNLREKQNAYIGLQEQMNDYEEYVESWAHETKTPLSLLTLLLDNRREELSETVSFRLDYIRSRMQESVDQMLFYARLKGVRKDYLFEYLSIRECVEEVLEDYKPLLEEKRFQVRLSQVQQSKVQDRMDDHRVYSDRRGLHFLLRQIISNAVKYCGREPELLISFMEGEEKEVLSISDNGVGVRSCDLPYIFEKGFTGGSGDGRKKATGMGLYLAKEMAKELNLTLSVRSEWGKGFEMRILFPVVQEGKFSCFRKILIADSI